MPVYDKKPQVVLFGEVTRVWDLTNEETAMGEGGRVNRKQNQRPGKPYAKELRGGKNLEDLRNRRGQY